jgi:hypothetical protein
MKRQLLMAILWAGVACAEEPPTIHFDVTTLDLGPTVEGGSYTGRFTFANLGTSTLRVGTPETTCGCTVASVTPDTLKQGEMGEIQFTLDLTNLRGPTEKTITVPSNDPANPKVTLTIKTDIKPVFDVAPQLLAFGDVEAGETVKAVVTVKRVDGRKLAISQVAASSEFIRVQVEPVEESEGKEARLVVTATANGKPQTVSDLLQIYVEGSPKPVLFVAMAGRLLGYLNVQPAALTWKVPDRGRWPADGADATMLRSVVISSSKKDSPLELRDFASTVEVMIVKVVPVEEGRKYEVMMKLAEPLDQSERGALRIETNLAEQPVIEVPLLIQVEQPEKSSPPKEASPSPAGGK